ncbi:MAG: hypothetical protein H6636_13865 [Anaerolineales bacterium]|nr:hypothetical protein [Anaerolineales bacterium]
MPYQTFHYTWEWSLQASPEDLWPLVADTNRFDRDSGIPPLKILNKDKAPEANLKFRFTKYGFPFEYEQEAFEWTYPRRFSCTRKYSKGVMSTLRVVVELKPRADGGTHLLYQVWVTPANFLGLLGIPLQIGLLFRYTFGNAFQKYDHLVTAGQTTLSTFGKPRLAPGGRARLMAYQTTLLNTGTDPALVTRLIETLENADDLVASRLRPYELADYWGADRKAVLELFLRATRAGLLNFRWDILCPLCRMAKSTSDALEDLQTEVHCESCHIDFRANFERSVELTFRPNEAVRVAPSSEFCIGGPQNTPHVIYQKIFAAGEKMTTQLTLEAGRYRLRAANLSGGQFLYAEPKGVPALDLQPDPEGWPDDEPLISLAPTLTLANPLDHPHLYLLERMAWSDQSVLAAEVIVLQQFRDLFSREALRPGEQISVGSLAVVFTDLRGSTQMYRQIGDAPAFGRVMEHFSILKQAVAEQNGSIVKTIGDAIMAVFRTPTEALRAMMSAQIALDNTFQGQLSLKTGIHFGPAIAVTLNERLDYFGTTVNFASRLEKYSEGKDIILSEQVYTDPEVQEFLGENKTLFKTDIFAAHLKGFDDEIQLWRVSRR